MPSCVESTCRKSSVSVWGEGEGNNTNSITIMVRVRFFLLRIKSTHISASIYDSIKYSTRYIIWM